MAHGIHPEVEVEFEILEETPGGLRIRVIGPGPQVDEYFMPYPEEERIADMKEV
jgi:hypothetical protein